MYAETVKARSTEISPFTRMLHAVYIPAFSVAALVIIGIYIAVEALDVIVNGSSDNVDDAFLFGFAAANLVIDIISSALFYSKGREILKTQVHSVNAISGDANEPEEVANLNMLSALTHVGGDTLRTLSVFIAATVATVTNAPSVQCDAWAAVLVSVTIWVAVIPLVAEIYKAAK
jgi:Co/Zn/Cd efflux system component